MERIIILALIVGTTLAAYFLHSYQKRRQFKRHIGEVVFTVTFVASVPIFLVNFLLGDPLDYYIGALGIFMFFLSINGFGVTKMLGKLD